MTALQIAIGCLAIGIPAVLYALYRSPPVPPMRTADARKIERETAQIRGLTTSNSDGSNPGYPIDMEPDLADELIGLMQRWAKWIGVACAAIAAAVYVVVPK